MWGLANSAFQVEGPALPSNWSRYIANGDADPMYGAVDFRHRYRQDIALAKSLGINTFRTGIYWGRVQPAPDRWDETELAYYDDLMDAITDAGMRPALTLHHFAVPDWIDINGGWADRRTVDAYVAYAKRMVDRYKGRNVIWITFNEALFDVIVETSKRLGKDWGPVQLLAALDNFVRAHREIYDYIHTVDPGALVTSNVAVLTLKPQALLPQPLNDAISALISTVNGGSDIAIGDELFLDRIKDKIDVVAIDYYYRGDTGLELLNVIGGQPWKNDFDPAGLYDAIAHYQHRYPDLPLVIAEIGMSTDNAQVRSDGYRRCQHLADTVQQLQRALADGYDVIGYWYWSLTDNYEWGSYRPRFGLYTVDAVNDPALLRHPTDAVETYRHIIRQGGVPEDYQAVKSDAGFRPGYRDEACL
jgi:beta-glucosidase